MFQVHCYAFYQIWLISILCDWYTGYITLVAIGTLRKHDAEGKENVSNKSLNEQNNGFVRAWQIVIHFFAVLAKTTTWKDQIQGVVENVNTWR